MRDADWATIQPAIRQELHEMRGHVDEPAFDYRAETCATCDQDADQLARAAARALGDR